MLLGKCIRIVARSTVSLFITGLALADGLPKAEWRTSLDRLAPGVIEAALPVFLSENEIAVLIGRIDGEPREKAVVFRRTNSQFAVAAQLDKTWDGDELYAMPGNRVLFAGFHEKCLYSEDLRPQWKMSLRTLAKQFPRTASFGEAGRFGRKLFRVAGLPSPLPYPPGELLATAGELLAYSAQDRVHVATFDGVAHGSIPVKPGITDGCCLEFAGPGRMLLMGPGGRDDMIIDFAGKVVSRIHPPGGWGFRHGWNSDGTRLLYDRYLRFVPPSTRLLEWFSDIMGAGLSEYSNAETIRVVDARSGGVCFDFASPKLLGLEGQFHADISPSGQLVAVTTLSELTIYRLPPNCIQQ